ncbi:uncharacterized protein [Euwallacea similis]|uniref:uncharacterized protein n=1 Tax=Euwallacea similis TaxID=1736056 RepID=UPI00344F6549
MRLTERIKVLQINADRSMKAHDMAYLEASKRDVDLIIASEPNRNLIRNNPSWNCDDNDDVGAYVRTDSITLERVRRDQDGTVILIGEDYTITRPPAEEASFQCKIPRMGAKAEDKGGAALAQMCAGLDLVTLNTGEPTFVRRNQTSWIDVTFASEGLAARVKNWQVLDQNEPSSPHRHIYFEVGGKKSKNKTRKDERGAGAFSPKLDKERYVAAFGGLLARKNEDVNCGHHAPDEIRSTRSVVEKGSRQSQKRTTVLSLHKAARKKLHREIKKQKKRNWTELCQALEDDIWGDGYRIVMKHLKPGNPYALTTDVILFDEEELTKATATLKSKAAPGPDGLGADAVKFSVDAYPET